MWFPKYAYAVIPICVRFQNFKRSVSEAVIEDEKFKVVESL